MVNLNGAETKAIELIQLNNDKVQHMLPGTFPEVVFLSSHFVFNCLSFLDLVFETHH